MTGQKKGLGHLVSRTGKLRMRAAVVLLLTFSLVLGMSGFAQANGKGHYKQAEKLLEKLIKQAEKAMKKSNKLGFSDLGQAAWALEAITRMRGLGIITGYDGNVFKPNSPVKQAEALTMIVRAFGFEEEALELGKRFSSIYSSLDEDISKGNQRRLKNYWYYDDDYTKYFNLGSEWYPYVSVPARWSLGYVLFGVEKGWVELSDINPEKPADRAWVAKVMVRALGYGEEAEKKMSKSLPFRDAPAIPAKYWGYVAQAVEMGLFEGYGDRTFQPNKPVTRAELATILDRFVVGELPEEMPYHVTGVVKYVSSSEITIRLSSGKEHTYRISRDALIVRGKSILNAKDIKVGDTVRILTNGSEIALLITVVAGGVPVPVPTREIIGTIWSISKTSKGEVGLTVVTADGYEALTLEANCLVTDGTRDMAVSTLAVGDEIIAKERNGKVYEIFVLTDLSTTDISGTIKAISIGDTVTLRIEVKAGDRRDFTLKKDAVITCEGKTLTYDKLLVGDVVTLRIQNKQAVRVWVTSRPTQISYVSGSVAGIGFAKDVKTIQVTDSNKATHKITLSPTVKVFYKDKAIDISQVYVGDKVQVKIINSVGVEVTVTERYKELKELTGIISSISDFTYHRAITVKQDDCKLDSFKVTSATVISYGYSEVSPASLKPGDKVKVTYDGDDAAEIVILARGQKIPFGDLYGKIESIEHEANQCILKLEHEGTKTDVKIVDFKTEITYGSTTLVRYNLGIGDVLRVRLDGDTAAEIKIVSRP